MNHLGKSEQNFLGCHHAKADEMYFQKIRHFNVIANSYQLAQNKPIFAVCNLNRMFLTLIKLIFSYLIEREGDGLQCYTIYIHP